MQANYLLRTVGRGDCREGEGSMHADVQLPMRSLFGDAKRVPALVALCLGADPCTAQSRVEFDVDRGHKQQPWNRDNRSETADGSVST
jgi:hypothetical protein